MISMHFSQSPIVSSVSSFRKSYESSPTSNSISISSPFSGSLSLRHSPDVGICSSLSATSSIFGHYFHKYPKVDKASDPQTSSDNKEEKDNSKSQSCSEILHKFKLDDSTLGIDCFVSSADTGSIQNSIISINFDNDSLEFHLKFPDLEKEEQNSIHEKDQETKEEKNDNGSDGNGSEVVTDIRSTVVISQMKKSSVLSKVRDLWSTRRRTNKSPTDILMSLPSSEESVISDGNSVSLYSPLSLKVPIKDSFRRRRLSFSIFQPFENQEKHSTVSNDNKEHSIKFKDYADMFIYNNFKYPRIHGSASSQEQESDDGENKNDTSIEVDIRSPTIGSRVSPLLASRFEFQKRRNQSFDSLKRNFSGTNNNSLRRSFSFSRSLRKVSVPAQVHEENTVAANKSSTLPPSILKNKVNQNYEAENINSLREQEVNLEDFMHNFAKFEMEKYMKEPFLEQMRLEQLREYYNNTNQDEFK